MIVAAGVFVLKDCEQFAEDVQKVVRSVLPATKAGIAAFSFSQETTDGFEYHWVIVVGFSQKLRSPGEAGALHQELATGLRCAVGEQKLFTAATAVAEHQTLTGFVAAYEADLDESGDGALFAHLGNKGEEESERFGSFDEVRKALAIAARAR